MVRRILAAVACAIVLASCGATTDASSEPRSIQGRWWEWAAAEPAATNPVADRTGEHCARNQRGDVWFLAGTFGDHVQRHCTVPLGARLVVPAVNLIAADESDCVSFMALATGVVEFDGAAVTLERIEHELITFTSVSGNPVTDTSGTARWEACGLWAQIDPPGAGEHKVRVSGTSGTFEVGAEYTLVVAAASPPAA